MKALIRCQHLHRGLAPPLEFISDAKDPGLDIHAGTNVSEKMYVQLVSHLLRAGDMDAMLHRGVLFPELAVACLTLEVV